MTSKTFNRYIWLLNTLLQHKRLTLEDISRRWEQSCLGDGRPLNRRTFIFHCEAVEEIFGVSIKCDVHDGYKYYIASRAGLREDPMRQWLLNSFSLSNMIEAGHNMKGRILFEDIPQGTEYLQTIIDAMQRGREIYVEHQKFRGEKTVQHLQPYAMKVCRQRWYVVGYIHEHQGIRNIALDRVLSMDVTEQSFEIPSTFDAEHYYAHVIGIYVKDGLRPQRVVLRSYGINTDYLRSLPLHPSQRELPGGVGEYTDFEYTLCLTPDLTGPILAMGEMVEVLEPAELRESVKQRLMDSLKRYS